MKALGIIRHIDSLGRVVVPMEVRKALGITEGTPMEILADEKGIYIRKYAAGCTFCNNMEELVEHSGVKVCRKCARAILEHK